MKLNLLTGSDLQSICELFESKMENVNFESQLATELNDLIESKMRCVYYKKAPSGLLDLRSGCDIREDDSVVKSFYRYVVIKKIKPPCSECGRPHDE